jgi:hypothetical protein
MAESIKKGVLSIREPEYDLTTIDTSDMDQVTIQQQDEGLVWHTLILSPAMVDTLLMNLSNWKAIRDNPTLSTRLSAVPS